MDEETLGKAFAPLFTTKINGIGLGLTVAREIADAHGWSITLKSPREKGTVVTVTEQRIKDEQSVNR